MLYVKYVINYIVIDTSRSNRTAHTIRDKHNPATGREIQSFTGYNLLKRALSGSEAAFP